MGSWGTPKTVPKCLASPMGQRPLATNSSSSWPAFLCVYVYMYMHMRKVAEAMASHYMICLSVFNYCYQLLSMGNEGLGLPAWLTKASTTHERQTYT